MPALSADREMVARGLEAQYSATLIRERKLADDRETKLLDAAEARLAKARSETVSVRRESQQALEQARADYAKLAGDLAQRDVAAKAEIEAYRAEAEQRVAQATPDELTALQQFADGDRTVAEPVLMAIRQARKRATLAAAKIQIARDERATADEHDIMREHGEATTLDVLKLYDIAAEDDPNDSKTNLMRGWLSQQEHEYKQATGLVPESGRRRAHRSSSGRPDIAGLGTTQFMQAKFADAGKNLQLALDLSLGLSAAEPTSAAAASDLADCWSTIGTVRRAQGDRTGAMAAYRSALDAAAQGGGDVAQILYQLAEANESIGDLQFEAGDTKAALVSHQQELDLGRRAEALDPKSMSARRFQGRALDRIGDEQMVIGDKTAALASFEAHNSLFRELAAEDPTSIYFQQELAAGFGRLGGVRYRNSDFASALEIYRKQLEVNKALAAQHPDSISLQIAVAISDVNIGCVESDQGDKVAATADLRKALDIVHGLVGKDPNAVDAQTVVAAALFNLALIPGSGIAWSEVAAQYQGMKDRGQLRPDMQDNFDEALRRHAQGHCKE